MSKSQPSVDERFEYGQAIQAGVIPEPPLIRRAFISAPASVDTSVIRQALESRGIAPYELDEIAAAGVSISELLDDCLKRADLVVVVLDGGKAKETILFELGYAAALKKRILVLVPSHEELPISKIPYLRTSPDNKEAIDFGLDQILSAPWVQSQGPREPSRRTQPIGQRADELLSRVRSGGQLSEDELEEIVSQALSASGIQGISSSSELMASGGRIDMVIWSDDFEPWLGNPLVIDVCGHLRNQSELETALDRLQKLLDGTHTEWGLLIYRSADFEPEAHVLRNPRVFVLPIEQLLESLREMSLGDFLRGLRNQRVHGRG